MNNTTQKVASRLSKSIKVKYIVKRFKDKFGEIEEESFNYFLEDLKDNPKITKVVFEDYNLPEFHYRLYTGIYTYEDVLEDYFSDCNGECEDICIYNVEEDKFVMVSKEIKYNVEEV